ncbi:MAG: GGDEF domain-containing protein [Ruminiclostridium sp.]|nr:GGDEF domain-containing protein [Ruminiclostridium sp.]
MGKINGEIIKCPEKNPHDGRKKTNIAVLFYRWVFLICVGILTLPGSDMKANGYALLESLAVVAVYNTAVTIYTLKNKEKINKASSFFIYFDIILLTVISYFSNGLESDIYLFIFFLLGYCGIFNDASFTLKIGIFSAVFYTASCIFSSEINNQELEITRLAIRDFLLILGAYGISRINYEVKKYDDLRKKEFRLARTDKLTGLANRHYFDQKLHEEVEYADEANAVLNVLMFDLDNFKSFNDTYGHIAGDKLLSLFADIIKQCIRKSDIPVRYGGEEFMILIRDMDIFIARNVGERIRRQLEKQRIYVGSGDNKKKVSVSCGIAQYPYHSKNIKQVIEYADQALYHAKETGKNAVVVFDEI